MMKLRRWRMSREKFRDTLKNCMSEESGKQCGGG